MNARRAANLSHYLVLYYNIVIQFTAKDCKINIFDNFHNLSKLFTLLAL